MFNKVKDVSVINKSITFCQVAQEIMTDAYDSSNSKQEFLSEVVRKVCEIDKLYLDASKKTNHQEESAIKQNFEFRVLQFTANKLSAVKNISEKEVKRISDLKTAVKTSFESKKNEIKQSIENRTSQINESYTSKKNAITKIILTGRNQINTTFEVKIQSAKAKFLTVKSKSVCVVTNLQENVKTRCLSAKNGVSEKIRLTGQNQKIKEILAVVEQKMSVLNKFTSEETAALKSNLSKVRKYATDKITASEFLNSLKKNTSSQIDHLKSALNYLKNTFSKNAHCVQKFNDSNSKFAESVSSKNQQILKVMKAENKKILENYIKKFEIELFYSPEESIKVVEKIRNAIKFVSAKFVSKNEKLANIQKIHELAQPEITVA